VRVDARSREGWVGDAGDLAARVALPDCGRTEGGTGGTCTAEEASPVILPPQVMAVPARRLPPAPPAGLPISKSRAPACALQRTTRPGTCHRPRFSTQSTPPVDRLCRRVARVSWSGRGAGRSPGVTRSRSSRRARSIPAQTETTPLMRPDAPLLSDSLFKFPRRKWSRYALVSGESDHSYTNRL